MQIKYIVALMALVTLSACHQSNVQARYSDASEECRNFAEEQQARIGTKGNNIAIRNAELVTIFSDCMANNGWQVATPKREGQNAARSAGPLLPGVPGGGVATGAGGSQAATAATANANRGVAQPQPVPQQAAPVQQQRVVPQAAPQQQQYFRPSQPQQAAPSNGRQVPQENYY